jgi:hypothetical protein
MEGDLGLTTQLGTTYLQQQSNLVNSIGSQLAAGQTNVSQSVNQSIIQFVTDERDFGYFGQVEGNYKDQVIATLGYRLDISSRNGDPNKFYGFPKASVAVNLNNFDFWNIDSINQFKLRAAYGETGAPAGFGATFTSLGSSNIGGNPGQSLGGLRGDPDVEPETASEFEIGFDGRFFDNNLTLGFTYYDNKTEDGILALPITPSSGFNETFQNATLITNKGIEIDISANLIKTQDLSFDINGSFTQNKNVVESLEGAAYFGLNGFTGTESGIAEGQPYGIQRHGQFLKDASGSLLLGSNGFPQADPELLIAGDPNPDFRAGLGTSLRYKNFNFTTQFETSQGNDVWNGTYSVMLFWGIHESTDILTTNDTGSTIYNAWGDPIPA